MIINIFHQSQFHKDIQNQKKKNTFDEYEQIETVIHRKKHPFYVKKSEQLLFKQQ